jgi:multiple antibiotic resistance protein
VNLAIVWIVFMKSSFIYRLMGEGGSKAFAKVASLFLAAIAVMMIRKGFVAMVHVHKMYENLSAVAK